MLILASPLTASAAEPSSVASDCEREASDECYVSFEPTAGRGKLHYYASLPAGAAQATAALIVVHGHPRDADRTFNSALKAVDGAGAATRASTLVIAPVFQVATLDAAKCRSAGVPRAEVGDVLWTCSSWIDGGPGQLDPADAAHGFTAFAAMDALIAEVQTHWPDLKTITVAGFSAGAQMVQHYIGFAAPSLKRGVTLRYVVSDPGTWLYFDPYRSGAGEADNRRACPTFDSWKYGTQDLPGWLSLSGSGSAAKARYAVADITYLEGALDSGTGRGTFHRILDKSCAAQIQGPYRLERGEAFAAYDRALIAPEKKRRVTVVPGCAHEVACVFTAAEAREALFGKP